MAIKLQTNRFIQQLFFGVGALVMVGMLVQISKTARIQVDLSQSQNFSVSGELLDLLAECEQRNLLINITAFTSQQGRVDAAARNQTIEELLMQLSRQNNQLQWKMVDFDADRNTAVQMGVSGYGTVVLEIGSDRVDIPERNIFYKQIGGAGFQFVGEQSIERALRKILFPNPKRIGVISGIGGRDLFDSSETGLSQALGIFETQGYTVEKLNVLQRKEISSEYDIVLVLEPQVELGLQLEQQLATFFQHGGQLLFASNQRPMILESVFQTRWADGVVAEPNALFPYWDFPIVSSNRISNLEGLGSDLSVVLQRGGAIISESANNGIQHSSIVPLSSKGWLERNQGTQKENPTFDAAIDWKGSASLILGIQNQDRRTLLMRDIDWMQNSMLSEIPANRQLIEGLLQWLNQSEEPLTGRDLRQPLLITQPQLSTIRWVVLLPLPLLVLLFGVLTWWRREHQ